MHYVDVIIIFHTNCYFLFFSLLLFYFFFFFFQAEDGIRDYKVTGVQTCALPISVVCQGQRKSIAGCSRGLHGPRRRRSVWVEVRRATQLRRHTVCLAQALAADRKSVV